MMNSLRIVFVDDEPHIVRALKRSMQTIENNWDMEFCQSGPEALAALERQPADILLTDMRMPGMDGAELLNIVRTKYPDTIRVVLSGYADKDCVYRTVGPAHAYLEKPCEINVLHDTLVRPLALRQILGDNDLRKVLGGMTNLPSIPEVFAQLLAELTSQDASTGTVAKIVERDMAMTAELLKLTNSSYFAIGARITSALGVVKILGLDVVQSLVLKIGIFREFAGRADLGRSIESLSAYSLKLGHLAEAFALEAGASTAEAKAAYCAAMLTPIGSLFLLDARTEEYEGVFSLIGNDLPLYVAEQAKFGVNHNLIGAYLLSLWGFSDLIVEAVTFAYTPSLCKSQNNHILTFVHAAIALGPKFPLLPPDVTPPRILDMAYLVECRFDNKINHWHRLVDAEGEKSNG